MIYAMMTGWIMYNAPVVVTRLARAWVKRTLASIARIIGNPKSEADFQAWKRHHAASRKRLGITNEESKEEGKQDEDS